MHKEVLLLILLCTIIYLYICQSRVDPILDSNIKYSSATSGVGRPSRSNKLVNFSPKVTQRTYDVHTGDIMGRDITIPINRSVKT